LGYGPITEKVKGFKRGVDLLRTQRYGDTWFIRVFIERGKYRMRNTETTSLEDAQEMAFTLWQSITREIEQEETFKLSTTRLFHFFMESQNCLVEMKQISPNTVSTKFSQIKSAIIPFIQEMGLKDPKRINANKDFRSYPTWRLGQGKDQTTVNNEIITIKEAFRWFRREEYIDYDPPYIESCTVDQRKRDQSNPPIVVDDFIRIKEWLDKYVKDAPKGRQTYMRQMFRCYVHICVGAALRPHEWRSLTWGMVKAGNENELNIPPWTKTGRRLVIFKSDKLTELKDIQSKLNIRMNKDTPLGVDPNTGRGFSDTTYTVHWKKMMEELDMPYTEYSMRSAGICSRLEAGVPIFTVARWAGNSVRVIEQSYTASIMRSQRMRRQVLMDEGKKWKSAGILLGNSEDYVIRELD
tara:strand:- start:368 stop:1597 length:1230 start_codon:yes stop_codon:yes gene_type:complete